jgi:hypothetical protein
VSGQLHASAGLSPGADCAGLSVGPRAGLDVSERRNSFSPAGNAQNRVSSSCNLLGALTTVSGLAETVLYTEMCSFSVPPPALFLRLVPSYGVCNAEAACGLLHAPWSTSALRIDILLLPQVDTQQLHYKVRPAIGRSGLKKIIDAEFLSSFKLLVQIVTTAL